MLIGEFRTVSGSPGSSPSNLSQMGELNEVRVPFPGVPGLIRGTWHSWKWCRQYLVYRSSEDNFNRLGLGI